MTRAEIALAAAEGQSTARIAASLRVCENTERKWRRRWCAAPGVARCATRNAARGTVSVRCRSRRRRRPADHRPMPGRRSRWSCRSWRATPSSRGSARPSRRRRCAAGVRGRPQTLAVPVVDLHHRSRLRRQSHASARPLRPDVRASHWGATTCDLCRRDGATRPGVAATHAPARQVPPTRVNHDTTAAARSPSGRR